MSEELKQSRYEVKFVCSGIFKTTLDIWSRYVPEGLSRTYEERIVNSIYFDSASLRNFHDNIAGLPCRSKTRLRWYGNTVAPEVMVLEHKIKHGHLSRKHTLPLKGLNLARTTWQELAEYLCEHAEQRSRAAACYFKNPVLRNSYRRQYYETRGHRLRMTVDDNLTYHDARITSTAAEGASGLRMNGRVIEFKAPVERANELQRLLRNVPLRVSRFSKYVVGVDQIRSRGESAVKDQRREYMESPVALSSRWTSARRSVRDPDYPLHAPDLTS
jgi:hypothetical protein